MAKSERLELGANIFYAHYRAIFNHCDNRPEKLSNSVKNAKRAITAFKVIQGHRGWYQSKARMRRSISDWY